MVIKPIKPNKLNETGKVSRALTEKEKDLNKITIAFNELLQTPKYRVLHPQWDNTKKQWKKGVK